MGIVAQVFIAWLYGHVIEYILHKHVLHNHKKFKKIFKRHFGAHHKISRKNEMYDENYLKYFKSESAFELLGLGFLLVSHSLLILYLPWAYFTLVASAISYYFVHRKAHIDVEWGREWLPWHAAHHMGKDQNLNWGVRLPIIDVIAGTYKIDEGLRNE
jgi:hypothetical protein